jgi:Immunoglobulin I-set domain
MLLFSFKAVLRKSYSGVYHLSICASVSWSKDGEPLVISSRPKERLHLNSGSGYLKIQPLHKDDAGVYQCSVFTQYGVIVGPKITLKEASKSCFVRCFLVRNRSQVQQQQRLIKAHKIQNNLDLLARDFDYLVVDKLRSLTCRP